MKLATALRLGASAAALIVSTADATIAFAQQELPTINIRAARRSRTDAAAPRRPEPAPVAAPVVNAASTLVDANTIAAQSASTSDTANLLRDVPGAYSYSAGGVSALPALNGLADDRLHVLVAGTPLISACANHMNPPLSYIAPSQVGRIQVYSGVVPVSVGGDSVGGAILVDPPAPVFAGAPRSVVERGAPNEPEHPRFALAGQSVLLKGEAGSFFRSNGVGYGGHLSTTAATENVSVTYNGSYARAENYRAGGAFKPAGFAFPWNPLPLTRSYTVTPWLDGDRVGSSAYQTQNHDFGLALRQDNHLLQINLGFQHIPYQNYPNQRMDMTENRSINGNVRYTGKYDWGVLEGQFYHQAVRHSMDFGPDKMFFYGSFGTILAQGMPMETQAVNTGAKLSATIDLRDRHSLRIGAEYQRYRYNEWWPASPAILPPNRSQGGMAPLDFININAGQRDRFDAFAELESRWTPQWTTLVGVRSDVVWMNAGAVHGYNISMYDAAPLYPATTFNLANKARTDLNWNGTAQATYRPDETQTYTLGYSLKSRSPNLYERYAWSPATMPAEMIGWFGDGNFYVGNRDLKPEVASTIGATAEWRDRTGRAALRFEPYFTYVSNYIDAQRCPFWTCGNTAATIGNLVARTSFVTLQFVNQDARIFGANLSGRAVLAENTPLGDFTAKGVVAYVNGQNVTVGNNLYQMMPINAKLALEQRIGGWSSEFETQLVGAKKNIDAVRNETKTGAYALFNWRGSYEWRNIRFDVGVENIFDAFYQQPLGGAYVGQLATMSGNNAGAPYWGVPVPGPGRTFYVATNVKF